MTFMVIHRLRAFSNAIRGTFMQHFTRFQLTVGSHGSSALTELLVNLPFNHRDLYYRGYLKKY